VSRLWWAALGAVAVLVLELVGSARGVAALGALAALAGVWTAVVSGLGGMRDGCRDLAFAPRLAAPLTRLAFGVRVAGSVLRVDVGADATTYELVGEGTLRIRHFGDVVDLEPGTPVRLNTPSQSEPGPRPSQPPGRSPREVRAAWGD